MNSTTTRLFLGLSLVVLTFGACKRSTRARDAAPVRASEADVQRATMKARVFAADGMCSDKLVEHYTDHLRYVRRIMVTLNDRLGDFKRAYAQVGNSRYDPNEARESRAAERLKDTYAFWRDVYTPFHVLYGTFWCLRRDDKSILSSAELERGIDNIWSTVKHLGPLPPEQHFEIKE